MSSPRRPADVSGSRILVTGVTGQIGFPLAAHLARDHEVLGAARLGDSADVARLEAAGIRPVPVDLAAGELDAVPEDVDFVVHLAAYQLPGLDYDRAIAVNAEATGLLLHHCRRARGALVASTASVYARHADRWHRFVEGDPLGDARNPHSPTYSVSKIGEEAVARTVARMDRLPVTLARINVAYAVGGLPALHLAAIRAGHPVVLRAPGPTPYSPIHQDDMNRQVPALLAAAAVPATIVNWAGDEVVTAEGWCGEIGRLTGLEPAIEHREFPGASIGSAMDVSRRAAITGPCTVSFAEGLRRLVASPPGGAGRVDGPVPSRP